jgi:hypothetical protein
MYIEARQKFDIGYVSPTGLDSFCRCPAKFYFSKLERLRWQSASNLPLIFGKCIHSCLWKAYDDPDKAFTIFQHNWTLEGNPEGDKLRNLERAYEMLVNFYQHHKSFTFYKPLLPPSGIVDSDERYSDYEAPFLIDIGGKYPMYGKIDRLVEWNNSIWPLDYKTSSQITARVCANFDICSQTLCYTLAASQLYDTILKGMILELIRTSPKNDEVMVHPLYVQDHWLDTFIETTIAKMEFIYAMNEAKAWPKNPSACAPYGQYGAPGYKCEFSDLCNSFDWTDQVRFYDASDWDPLKNVNIEKHVGEKKDDDNTNG